MSVHFEQSRHNSEFHQSVCDTFPDRYNDWKITVLFYTALHYLKGYYASKNINIGSTHFEIERSISPYIFNAPYKVSFQCWRNYKAMFRYSQTARYDGITDRPTFEKSLDNEHAFCVTHLEVIRNYVRSRMGSI